MADRYAVTGNQDVTTASPGDTSLHLFSPGTTHRGQVYYMSFSADGTMADQVNTVVVQRTTAVGTEGTGVVPAPTDSDAPASILDGAENHTANPTFTAATELWDNDVHVRALAQVQLQPDGHLMIPATANAGIAATGFSGNYTGGLNATFHYLE
jgi:hypothetical protein